MLTNGLTTSTFFWKYVAPALAARHTVVLWDFAGHGASGPARTAAATDIEAQPAIMARVMDAVGIRCAAQIGWSLGCQVVLELLRQEPARASAIGLLFGPSGNALSSTRLPLPAPLLRGLLVHARGANFTAVFQRLTHLTRVPGGFSLLRASGLIGAGISDPDLAELLTQFRSVDAPSLRQLACSAERHTAHDVLAACRLPVLLMAGDADPFAPFETVGAPMHALCPRAELVRLAACTHTALLDQPEPIAAALLAFLARQPSAPR
jgi:pimeloyl-ACP methyl ester carboxylesterase